MCLKIAFFIYRDGLAYAAGIRRILRQGHGAFGFGGDHSTVSSSFPCHRSPDLPVQRWILLQNQSVALVKVWIMGSEKQQVLLRRSGVKETLPVSAQDKGFFVKN